MWTEIIKIFSHPLIVAIISIFFAVYIGNKFLRAKERRIALEAFKSNWISTKKLKYKDISGRKEYSQKNPSTQNHLANKVQEIVDHGKTRNVLLISDAMAGKTYFTVNYLKKLENAYVLIPKYDRFDELYDFIPKAPRNANYKIVLLDDIHTYINTGVKRLASFIETAIGSGYIIWANTISGSDFEIVRNYIPINILSTFNEITIPSTLSDEEGLKIAQSEKINKLPSDFDRNIGSIFYPITQVRERYYRLDRLCKLLLLVIKQLYLVGIYRPPARILKSNLRKLFDSYEHDISSETVSKIFDELEKSGFLLKSIDPRNICFEEKYLRIVVEPNLKVKDFMKDISEIFPKNLATYTQAMQSASNYVEAGRIYQEMRSNNIQPHDRPFTVLIGKANDSDIGLIWLKEMDKLGISPSDFIINALLRTAHSDIEKKERVITELEFRKIEVKEKIKNLVKAPKIQLDLYGYSNLMNLSGNYEKALELFCEMKRNKISPDSISYNILIKLSNDLNKGMNLLNEMIALKISPDDFTYGILINLTNDYNKGRKLFDEMVNKGILPNEAIYGTLIKLANDFIVGKKLLNEMIERGISTSAARFGFVINLAPDFTEGKKLFDKMISMGITPTCIQYGTIINISPDYIEAKKLFDEMISKEIVPTEKEYTTLINISPDFKEGKKTF